MPLTQLSELLPIPTGERRPHAYQVFGLAEGEQDADKVQSAIRSTVKRLQAAKDQAEPEVWRAAAKLVQQARGVLSDPDRKAELDARFGIVSIEDLGREPETPAPDPLEGLLPEADPLAAYEPTGAAPASTAAALSSSTSAAIEPAAATGPVADVGRVTETGSDLTASTMPAGLFGTPSATPAADPRPASVVAASPRAAYRRRRPVLGIFVFATLAICMTALMAGLSYLVFFGGTIEVTRGAGQLAIRTSPPAEPRDGGMSEPNADPQTPKAAGRRRDDVIGSLGPESKTGDHRRSLGSELKSPVAVDATPSGVESSASGSPSAGSPDTATAPQSDAGAGSSGKAAAARTDASKRGDAMSGGTMSEDAMSEDAMSEDATETRSGTEMAAGKGSGGEDPSGTDKSPGGGSSQPDVATAIAEAETQIRSANWDRMKQAAARAAEAAEGGSRGPYAKSLHELAELSTFYRGGIRRAIGQLGAGHEFEIVPSLKVIVVEAAGDRLTLRRGAKNYSYTLDTLPPSLAHSLATFSMPADAATTIAAKAAYQAVATQFNEGYREYSLELLRGLREPVEGADTKRLADTIESLYP